MDNLREEIEKIAWLLAGSLVDPKITVEQATEQILTLLDKEIQKARVDEIYKLNKAIAKGGWHKENAIRIYPYILDRIKQLEKGIE